MKHAMLFVFACACGRLGFGGSGGGGGGGPGGDASGIDGGSFVPTWQSGSRIHARVWRDPDDGSDPFIVGWHDTMLGTDCQAAVAADGVERCLPGRIYVDDFFSDAACTQPIAVVHDSTCGHNIMGQSRDAMGRTHAFTFGTVYSGAVYDGRGGSCILGTLSNAIAYRVGLEVAPAMFAATQYENVQVSSQYQHSYIGFGDGSRDDLGAVGIGIGTCYPDGSTLGTTQCRPDASPMLVPVFRDAACTQRAYLWLRKPTDPSSTSEFLVEDPALCGTPFTAYGPVANVTASTYYTRTTTGCTSNATPSAAIMYTGAPSPNAWPSGTVAPGPRRGRIGTLYWTGPDGIAIPFAPWDFELQQTCYGFVAEDGQFRCLPRRPKQVTVCPDSSCTGTPAMLSAACYGAAPYDGPYYPSCEDAPWPVSTLSTVSGASLDVEGTCTQLPAPGGAVYSSTAANPVPASMFPPLVETIE